MDLLSSLDFSLGFSTDDSILLAGGDFRAGVYFAGIVKIRHYSHSTQRLIVTCRKNVILNAVNVENKSYVSAILPSSGKIYEYIPISHL